jgi:hypothetical protein
VNEFSGASLAVLIPIVAIVGGFLIAGLSIHRHIRLQEFAHRERLAMIEKGQAPPDRPPADYVDRLERVQMLMSSRSPMEDRTRRGGVVLIGIGLGIAFLIWMAGHDRDSAIGVGGFLVIMGAAIYISSYFGSRRQPVDSPGKGPGATRS